METDTFETALAIFRRHGGVLRTSEAIRQGIHPRTLYAMRDSGKIQSLSRGLYRLADLPPLSNPDLVIVARKFPHAVICLVSALAFHELTTQVPHAIDVALPSRAEHPVLDYPPIRTFWFSGRAGAKAFKLIKLTTLPFASTTQRRVSLIPGSIGTSLAWMSRSKRSSSIAGATISM